MELLKETQPDAKVILITPSTVDMDAWAALGLEMGMPSEMVRNRSPEAAKRIRDAVLAVAKEADVGVVDAWKLHDDAVNNGELKPSELFSDGLHYSERGYAVSITSLSRSNSLCITNSSVRVTPFDG